MVETTLKNGEIFVFPSPAVPSKLPRLDNKASAHSSELSNIRTTEDKQLFHKIKYNLLIYSITLLLLKSEKINKR